MTESSAINLLIEERDIHLVYLDRHRAEFLVKTLWQLTQGRISWRAVSTSPIGSIGEDSIGANRGSREPRNEGLELSPRFLEYTVPAVAVLDFDAETRRIWATRLSAGMSTLSEDERFDWKEHLLRPRYSAVFQIVHRWGMVRRSDSVRASRELASAALKLSVFSEAMK